MSCGCMWVGVLRVIQESGYVRGTQFFQTVSVYALIGIGKQDEEGYA